MARILIIRQFYFPLDIRVRREVEALLADGHEVDVICLSRPDEPRSERCGRLRVRRLPFHHQRGGAASYVRAYLTFFLAATALAGWRHLRRRYALVQVNSIPDALVFAAVIPRLFGARVLLDLHEVMPEFFATRFKTRLDHPGVRLLAWLEQKSIRFADAAITCTDQMRDAFVARGADRGKIGVVLNAADETIFDHHRYPRTNGRPDRFTLICHGSIEERYGLDTVIRAVALLKDEIPGLHFQVIGEGAFKEDLQRLAHALGVACRVSFSDGFVPMEDLLRAIAGADAGVVAMKRDAFRDLTHCNKMYEFIAMRVPVLISRTRSVEAYFPDTCFQFFDSDDAHDLARAIRELHADPELGRRLVTEAARVNEPYRWPDQRARYLRTVSALVSETAVRPVETAKGTTS